MRIWTDKEVRDLFMGVNVARSNDRSDAEMKEFDRWLIAHDKRVAKKTEQRIIKLLEDEAMAKSGGLIFSNFIFQREFKLPDGSDVVLLNDVFEAMGRQLDWLVELIKGETQ